MLKKFSKNIKSFQKVVDKHYRLSYNESIKTKGGSPKETENDTRITRNERSDC